jgi:hypothetical protein
LLQRWNIMEQAHRLSRKRASLLMAANAASASARLIHDELARRYDVKAAEAAPHMHLEDDPPIEPYGARKSETRSPEEQA